MNDHQRSIRLGLAAILCAAALRFLGSGRIGPVPSPTKKARNIPASAYLETGQNVRFSPSLEASLSYPGESAAPRVQLALPVFSDASHLEVLDTAAKAPDVEKLLSRPLDWDLTGEEPSVLILSTHTTESYTRQGENYVETSSWRTLDENYNMLSVGDVVAGELEKAGVRVVRDRELHDYPSYNGSYAHARTSLEALLKENPSVKLVLDLHRDASDESGPQMRPVVQTGEGTAARMMLVLGGGHDRWAENLSLGLKLMAQLEAQAPGITRPLLLGKSTFNQDLCTGAVLVEMGAAGNSHQEARLAARQLAKAIVALAKGTM